MGIEAELVIDPRFRGPPSSGNGGYVCGRLAGQLGRTARVRLHAPPPLDRPLRVEGDAKEVRLWDGETLLATAVPGEVDVEAPPPPDLETAREAVSRYPGFTGHPFPTCFVCGPERSPGDGLRIFAGAAGERRVAAPFHPPEDLVDPSGHLRPEVVWAALDCPGYFSVAGEDLPLMLLGEMAAEVRAPVPGRSEDLVVYAWGMGEEGRKARCASALATADGEILAVARATWIRLRSD